LFEDFGDSALKFTLYFFVKDPFFSPKIKSDLRFALDKKFRENNINIPFPQRTVHLQKEN
jgi:small-conductance mechanosensitive channel